MKTISKKTTHVIHRLVQLGTSQDSVEVVIIESKDQSALERERDKLQAHSLNSGLTIAERRYALRTVLSPLIP